MDPDYFPISGLTIERRLVWLRLYGQDIKGDMRVNRRGDRVLRIIGDDGRTLERAPNHVQRDVSLWRPFDHDLATWPEPLPAPAVLMRDHSPVASGQPKVHQGTFPKPLRLAPAEAPPLPSAIAYSEPGRISIEECEARIRRALMTDRALPDTDRAKLKVRSNWPETGYGPGDYPPEITTRWTPFEQDVSDYLTAMGWLARLMPFERKLFRLRARGMSFARMAEECGGRSDEWARQQYIRGLVRAWTIANGDRVEWSNRPSGRLPAGESDGPRSSLAESQARPLVPAGG